MAKERPVPAGFPRPLPGPGRPGGHGPGAGRFFNNRPGNGQPLLLPAGKVHSLLPQHAVVTLRESHDKIMGLRGFGRGNHLFIGSIQTPISDILHDTSCKEPCVL